MRIHPLKTLLGLLILASLLRAPAQATFTQVQLVQSRTAGVCGINSGTFCSVSVAACGTNNVLVLVLFLAIGGTSSAVTGCGGTWQHATGCTSTPTDAEGEECWYNLSPNAAGTLIAATISVNSSRGADFYEFSSTGTPAFDAAASNVNGNAAATMQPGAAPTVTGANDVIIQGGFADASATISSVDTGYTLNTAAGSLSRGTATLTNTTVNTTPTFTLSTSVRFTASVISFRDAAAVTFHANQSVIVVGP